MSPLRIATPDDTRAGAVLLEHLRLQLAYFREDAARNESIIVRAMLLNYRLVHAVYRRYPGGVLRWTATAWYKVVFHLFSILLAGGELMPGTSIGPGIQFHHRLTGTVIHPQAVIGARCTIFHGVTIGAIIGPNGAVDVPTIGNDVVLYPGCKVLGGISIGDGAVIGANAVVVDSVPPYDVVLAPKAVSMRTRSAA